MYLAKKRAWINTLEHTRLLISISGGEGRAESRRVATMYVIFLLKMHSWAFEVGHLSMCWATDGFLLPVMWLSMITLSLWNVDHQAPKQADKVLQFGQDSASDGALCVLILTCTCTYVHGALDVHNSSLALALFNLWAWPSVVTRFSGALASETPRTSEMARSGDCKKNLLRLISYQIFCRWKNDNGSRLWQVGR